MSEYQYYEFTAIDRALTREQMSRLRALSTRATHNAHALLQFLHVG